MRCGFPVFRLRFATLNTNGFAIYGQVPSHHFVATLGWGIEGGHLSARRAATVVGTSLNELGVLFTEHGLKTPFDLQGNTD